MNIRVERRWPKAKYTIGRLYVDDTLICNSLEDTDRGLLSSMSLNYIKIKKVQDETAIPKGTYEVDMSTVSPKFKSRPWAKKYNGIVPRLKGVPGFSGVLIHPGTDENSTSGCLIVGKNTAVGKVTSSQLMFYKIMDEYLIPASKRGEKITITIE